MLNTSQNILVGRTTTLNWANWPTAFPKSSWVTGGHLSALSRVGAGICPGPLCPGITDLRRSILLSDQQFTDTLLSRPMYQEIDSPGREHYGFLHS